MRARALHNSRWQACLSSSVSRELNLNFTVNLQGALDTTCFKTFAPPEAARLNWAKPDRLQLMYRAVENMAEQAESSNMSQVWCRLLASCPTALFVSKPTRSAGKLVGQVCASSSATDSQPACLPASRIWPQDLSIVERYLDRQNVNAPD